ncbi:hypothetical protein CTAM01_06691, partial [Colletotrichum tamarilloi]
LPSSFLFLDIVASYSSFPPPLLCITSEKGSKLHKLYFILFCFYFFSPSSRRGARRGARRDGTGGAQRKETETRERRRATMLVGEDKRRRRRRQRITRGSRVALDPAGLLSYLGSRQLNLNSTCFSWASPSTAMLEYERFGSAAHRISFSQYPSVGRQKGERGAPW